MSIGLLIKKFISFFFEPLGIVITLFILGLYYLYKQKHKRAGRFLFGSVLSLILFSYPPVANYLIAPLENQYQKYQYIQDVKYIHVLGNGHTTDQTQPLSSQVTNDGTKRVLEGIILHNNMPETTIIFTGYKGRTDTPNAVMNSKLSYALGVEENATLLNPKPEDTREEAEFTKTVVGEEPFILVTSASHMPRAMMLFRSLGMNPIAAPTAFYKDSEVSWMRLPSAHALFVSTLAMHEYLGIVYAQIKEILS